MASVASPRQDDASASTSQPWIALPEDVAMRVLARLPVADLVRARTVCKPWSLLTSTSQFRALCNAQSCREPYFPVMFAGEGGNRNLDSGGHFLFFGYDHTTAAWQALPPLDFQESVAPVAAAGGILCFTSRTGSFLLCDPVAGSIVELPGCTWTWALVSSVHIVVDRRAGLGFRVIMVVNRRPEHRRVAAFVQSVMVYDSATEAWRISDEEPRSSWVFSYGAKSAVCGGTLYCMVAVRLPRQLAVVAYDIRTEVWQDVVYEVPPCPEDGNDYQLTQVVECSGAIYMVLARGYGGCRSGGVVSSLYILKLEVTTKQSDRSSPRGWKPWRQVTCLCSDLREELQKGWLGDDDSGAIVCVGHGSRICISAGVGFVLMYDVGTGDWSRLPPCSQLLNLGDDVVAEPCHFPMELRFSLFSEDFLGR